MAIGINDLDDDDFGMGFEPSNQEPPVEPPSYEEPPRDNQNDDDFVSDFLKTRGIDDLSRIKFEDDNEQIVERNWNDLSKEEKINILNTPLEIQKNEDNTDLTEEEINLLSQIRQSNMTPTEYLQQLSAGEVVQEPKYSIDELSDDEVYLLDLESRVGELSDDEVYLLDLESRVGELTEEQAAQALNIAKQQSEELYQKQIEGIRKEYKEREDLKNQQTQAQLEQEQREAFEEYQAQVVDAINNFTSIGNLDLNFEDTDKETLAEFMLSQDESGKNYLYEALQDPETLTRAAWFILNGEEAFNSITDYFTNQIKLISENQYKKGLEDGKKGTAQSNKPTVIIDNSKKTNTARIYKSIEDLDDE